MLQKSLRMRKNMVFKYVFANGSSYVSKHVVVYIIKVKPSKYGFIASKKIGNAVARNKAKRLLREVVRLNLEKLTSECQMIFIARKPIINASYTEVEKSVLYIWRKAGIIK